MTYRLTINATTRHGTPYEQDSFWVTAEQARDYMMNHEDRIITFSLNEMGEDEEPGCAPGTAGGCPGPSCCWSWD